MADMRSTSFCRVNVTFKGLSSLALCCALQFLTVPRDHLLRSSRQVVQCWGSRIRRVFPFGFMIYVYTKKMYTHLI